MATLAAFARQTLAFCGVVWFHASHASVFAAFEAPLHVSLIEDRVADAA